MVTYFFFFTKHQEQMSKYPSAPWCLSLMFFFFFFNGRKEFFLFCSFFFERDLFIQKELEKQLYIFFPSKLSSLCSCPLSLTKHFVLLITSIAENSSGGFSTSLLQTPFVLQRYVQITQKNFLQTVATQCDPEICSDSSRTIRNCLKMPSALCSGLSFNSYLLQLVSLPFCPSIFFYSPNESIRFSSKDVAFDLVLPLCFLMCHLSHQKCIYLSYFLIFKKIFMV